MFRIRFALLCVFSAVCFVQGAPLWAKDSDKQRQTFEAALSHAYQSLYYGRTLKEPMLILGAIAAIVKIQPDRVPEHIDLEEFLNEAQALGRSDVFIHTKADDLRDAIERLQKNECKWQYSCEDDLSCTFKRNCLDMP